MMGVYPLRKSNSDPNLPKLLKSIYYTFLRNFISLVLHKRILFPSPFANYLAKIICIIIRSRWLTHSIILSLMF